MNILRNITKSWQTTVFGGIPGLAIAVEGYTEGNWLKCVLGISTMIAFALSKDASVTGAV